MLLFVASLQLHPAVCFGQGLSLRVVVKAELVKGRVLVQAEEDRLEFEVAAEVVRLLFRLREIEGVVPSAAPKAGMRRLKTISMAETEASFHRSDSRLGMKVRVKTSSLKVPLLDLRIDQDRLVALVQGAVGLDRRPVSRCRRRNP